MITRDIIFDGHIFFEDCQIQLRRVERIFEDGELIGTKNWRVVLDPGLHNLDDIKKQGYDPRIADIVEMLWTPEVIQARKDFIKKQDDLRQISINKPV